jgi:hypothetical protein
MGSLPYFTTQTSNQAIYEKTIASIDTNFDLNIIDNKNGDYVQARFGGALVAHLHC